MLSLPAFLPALVGSDTECEALLAEENVSAVTLVNGDDCVVLRELADISLLFVDFALTVETANPVVAVAESLENLCAYSCHDYHVENNIDRVCKLDTDLGETAAYGTH